MRYDIVSNQAVLGQVFGNDYSFEVPNYQRPYAWTQENAERLLDDVMEAMERREPYFLGALVLVKQAGLPASSVLDGQQRLTTLTALFAVLRDLAEGATRAELGELVTQPASRLLGKSETHRFLPRQSDRTFFAKHVQAAGASATVREVDASNDSQRRIAANVAYFRERIGAMDAGSREDLCAFLVRDCFLIVIAVADGRAARRIFTALNSRGVDLTSVDILKAKFLDQLSGQETEAFAARWDKIQDALGDERFKRLFEHVSGAARGVGDRQPRQDLDEDEFVSDVPAFSRPEEFMATLETASEAMSLAWTRTRAKELLGVAAADHLRSLSRLLPDDAWMTPLLAKVLRDRYSAGLATFLARLEKVAYLHHVLGAKPRAGEGASIRPRASRYADIVSAVHTGRQDDGMDLSHPEKAAFRKALSEPAYDKPWVKQVLQRLDDLVGNNSPVYEVIETIEHVLPQTVSAGSGWARDFPDALTRPRYTALLGNLIFLTRPANARVSNGDYADKKREYASERNGVSTFSLTVDAMRETAWTPKTLVARQDRLLGKLATLWDLHGADHKAEELDGLPEADDVPAGLSAPPAASRIPAYTALIQPFVDTLRSAGRTCPIKEIEASIATALDLSPEDLAALPKPTSKTSFFTNGVNVARTVLRKGGVIEMASKGNWALTRYGETLTTDDLKSLPQRVRDGAIANPGLGQTAPSLV